jgi:hypothetical protein
MAVDKQGISIELNELRLQAAVPIEIQTSLKKEKRVMKKLAILAAVAAVAALVPIKALAGSSPGLILNVSASVKSQSINTTGFKGSIVSSSFSEKNLYTLVSNALAGSSGALLGLAPTNLPANGYIAFNPGTNDGNVFGFFYVTNKSGLYWPLSGLDTNGQYYSFAELDTYILFGNPVNNNTYINFGFGDYCSDIASYNLNSATNGSVSTTSYGLLYVHDNPYAYDDLDNPDYFFQGTSSYYGVDLNNTNAIEIRGIVTGSLQLKTNNITSGSLSLTGSGNFYLNGNQFGSMVTSGKAALSP